MDTDLLHKINFDLDPAVHLHVHNNTPCSSCDLIEVQMVRVGAIIFCTDCFKTEFKTMDPVTLEKDKYRIWVRKVFG